MEKKTAILLALFACVASGSAVAEGEAPAGSVTPVTERSAGEVSCIRFSLRWVAGNARATAEAYDTGVPSVERQALLLASLDRVLNELPTDGLPADCRDYIQGRREIAKETTPRIMTVFLAVASGSLEEDLLTETLAPVEEEKNGRLAELAAKYPEAAKLFDDAAITNLTLDLVRDLKVAEKLETYKQEHPECKGRNKEESARQRLFAESVEYLLKFI